MKLHLPLLSADDRKRSWETFTATIRQGVKEIGAFLYGPGTIAQHAEYGMPFTKTPGEVADGLRGTPERGSGKDEPAPSSLDSYLRDAKERGEQTREPEREAPEVERE